MPPKKRDLDGTERREAQDFPRFCEVHPGADYTPDETEFMLTMHEYKKKNQRPFPTWREVLHVLYWLGYRKVAQPGPPPKINEQDRPLNFSASSSLDLE